VSVTELIAATVCRWCCCAVWGVSTWVGKLWVRFKLCFPTHGKSEALDVVPWKLQGLQL
jgi:hypothetical protein